MHPFPHILTYPKYSNGFLLRFVHMDSFKVGDEIYEHDGFKHHWCGDPDRPAQLEPLYNVYKIDEIRLVRLARGTWHETPLYYECTGKYIDQRFKTLDNAKAEN